MAFLTRSGSIAGLVADLLVALGASTLLSPTAAIAQPEAPPSQSGGPPLQSLPDRPIELPQMTCEALSTHPFASVQQVTFRIMSATVQSAQPGRAEFCLVKGYVAPQVQFALYLPTKSYTGRYLQGGCGGMCGVIGDSLQPSCDSAIAFGGSFALEFNNSGHVGAGIGDGAWAKDAPELREDYAYRATHAAQVASKAIVAAYYGKPPRWSYFQGCSDGGREALMESLRYPTDFNGIVAGSVFSMPAVMEQFLWDSHVALKADDQKILTSEATALLHRAVLDKCDALDGARDGQIDDPRLCHYDPAKLACRSGQQPPACLTPEQITAARQLYQGPMDSAGHRLFPGGLPYGSELLWSQQGALTATGIAAGGYLQNLAFPNQLPPDFTWRNWTFDLQSFEKLEAAAAVYDPRSPDLRPFRDAGGKLILWQGTADQASGIYGMPAYYQDMRDVMGGLEATRRFARLFLIPGVYHCGGGYIPYQEDFLGAMVNWVERDQPPVQIVAAARLQDGSLRQRPLFAYPERAKYVKGDLNNPGSFVGVMPPKEPDDHYDWAGAHLHP
jgi:tannase/feruloyl esterase